METLKIDRTKLITVRNFAVSKGITSQQVYNWIKAKKVESTKIDGITFIVLS